MSYLKSLLEQSGQELGVLLLAVLWGILRVSGILVKKLEKGNLIIRLLGKEIVFISGKKAKDTRHTPQVKEKTKATSALDTQKTDNHIS
jgi:hypothetical protein